MANLTRTESMLRYRYPECSDEEIRVMAIKRNSDAIQGLLAALGVVDPGNDATGVPGETEETNEED